MAHGSERRHGLSRGLSNCTGQVPANGERTVQITGQGGVPATGVSAVALNVAVVSPVANGQARIRPANAASTRPLLLDERSDDGITSYVYGPGGLAVAKTGNGAGRTREEPTCRSSPKTTSTVSPPSSTANAAVSSTTRAPPASTMTSPCTDHWNWPPLVGLCAGAGIYATATGGFRLARGVRQLYRYDQAPYGPDGECTTGDNLARFARGVLPFGEGDWLDWLGGLP